MSTHGLKKWALLLTFWLALHSKPLRATDLTVSGNLTVTGTSDFQGDALTFGVRSDNSNPGFEMVYTDGSSSILEFNASRIANSWKWQQNGGTALKLQMSLSEDNVLKLYDDASTPVAQITLDPLGTSTFENSLTVNGDDNQMPNQTLTGAGSVITEGLGDARYLIRGSGLVIGSGATATGSGSFALGAYTTASGASAFAVGLGAVASGDGSIATGVSSATNLYASAFGGSSASGSASTAGGVASATGDCSTAFGQAGASGVASFASGYYSSAGGDCSFAAGGSSATSLSSIAMGTSTADGVGAVALGENAAANSRGAVSIGYDTTADGLGAVALGEGAAANDMGAISIGYYTSAGFGSAAIGWHVQAPGSSSTALGNFTEASGFISSASGYSTIASGDLSTSMGARTLASGYSSTSMGLHTIASGYASTVMGNFTLAPSLSSTAMGQFNVGAVSTSGETEWHPADSLLEIGNGVDAEHPSNAMVVYKSGDAAIQGNLTTGGVITAQPGGDIPMFTGD